MKRPWQSRTINFNLLAFIALWGLATFYPSYHRVMCGNVEAILSIVFIINMILRKLTREPITFREKNTLTLLLLLQLSSCASTVPQVLDPDKFYKRDLPFCVKDIGCYEGTAVLPVLNKYEFEIAPKGDANIDLLVLNTCHRELTIEKPQKESLGFFKKLFGKDTSGFKLQFDFDPDLERDGACTFRVETFERDKGRHAWAIMRLQHVIYQLPASLHCNGKIESFTGVSLCQGKQGLTQQIVFGKPVMIESGTDCPEMKRVESGTYQWDLGVGECSYTIRSIDDQLHHLLTIGYQGLLVRELK